MFQARCNGLAGANSLLSAFLIFFPFYVKASLIINIVLRSGAKVINFAKR